MKKTILAFVLLMNTTSLMWGQELFPATESASSQPKGVPGVRFSYENYKELPSRRARYRNELRFIYGLTDKLSTSFAVTASNHHQKKFPTDLNNFFRNHHQRNFPQNPYQVEGLILHLKYRCLSIDRRQRHLRMAVFAAAAKSFVPHSEAEPHLGDNSGVEGGWITTLLLKRFALSLNNGYILPFGYKAPDQKITFDYGKAAYLNLSMGYRLIPSKYSDYNNLNVNVHLEFLGKTYGKAEMTVDGAPYSFEDFKNYDQFIYNSLQANTYVEVRPSIQFIFYSTTRLDLGVAQRFYSQSYLHFYPLFFVALQKNLYKREIRMPNK
jgi:hypothetical protein